MYTFASAPRALARAHSQPFALPVLFALFGLIMGSWAGRIPAVVERLQVSHSTLSMVLLCGGLGGVLSYPLSSFLMARFGARKSLLWAGLALLAALVWIGMAPTVPRLMLAVLMLGITASTFNVAINAAATGRERRSGKSELSTLHGICCAGGLAGATLGSLMAGLKIAPGTHFLVLAAPLALVLWSAFSVMEADETVEKVEKQSFSLPRGPLALLGLLGFLGAMSEGSIADWSGVFLKTHFGASDALAPLALSCFTLTMLSARMLGDRLKVHYGAQRLVSVGSLVAAGGLFFAVLAPNAYVSLGGFAFAGLGLALLFPFVFSAAGAQGPMALAAVASMAYSGSLMGPPVIGAIAHFVGMQAAIAFLGAVSLAIALVASRTRLLK
jgi:MFS family permease